jgi:acetoin utilization protein AcuB
MTRELRTASETTTIREAADSMLKHGISCLPVVNTEGRAVGIVTWRDLLRALNV